MILRLPTSCSAASSNGTSRHVSCSMLPMIWPPPFDLLSQCCALHLRLSSPDPSGAEHVWQHSARSPQPKNQYREDLSLITWLCKHHCHLCCACLQSLPAEWSGQGTSRYKRPPPGSAVSGLACPDSMSTSPPLYRPAASRASQRPHRAPCLSRSLRGLARAAAAASWRRPSRSPSCGR